mmetsp:Transcript_789/g.1428  ORF Transcript_789/g.1428 Transcript_789/m.1428 type:complete len:159 (+) Transcript_789:936-1412(+)
MGTPFLTSTVQEALPKCLKMIATTIPKLRAWMENQQVMEPYLRTIQPVVECSPWLLSCFSWLLNFKLHSAVIILFLLGLFSKVYTSNGECHFFTYFLLSRTCLEAFDALLIFHLIPVVPPPRDPWLIVDKNNRIFSGLEKVCNRIFYHVVITMKWRLC